SNQCVSVSVNSVIDVLPSVPSVLTCSKIGDGSDLSHCSREITEAAPIDWSLSAVILDSAVRNFLFWVIGILVCLFTHFLVLQTPIDLQGSRRQSTHSRWPPEELLQ